LSVFNVSLAGAAERDDLRRNHPREERGPVAEIGESTMRYRLDDPEPHVKTIAIEEHFSTPMQRQKSRVGEFEAFYLSSRSEHAGHSITGQLADLDEQRLACMDAAGVDIQSLSFTTPGPQAFEAAEAILLAEDANDRLHEAVKRHPDRFAGFAALACGGLSRRPT
jgi:hypothetical protein